MQPLNNLNADRSVGRPSLALDVEEERSKFIFPNCQQVFPSVSGRCSEFNLISKSFQ